MRGNEQRKGEEEMNIVDTIMDLPWLLHADMVDFRMPIVETTKKHPHSVTGIAKARRAARKNRRKKK